ncbi:chemotaxis protein CheW [Aminirod propionatiphilus]|uniref:Purine-binding chemotaxis protein CheW n=1 Tax=Aminirod propionatiphilus TaxID=3415223 RepID=A0ACD1DVF5_9BACT|nr:purine-binding chemotaxis protein CheW [Synergistota bacterium]
MAAEQQIVVFSLGREHFGVDIAGVREIVRFESCRSLPGAPDFVRGVINLRGELVTLVDLTARFSMTPSEVADDQKKVVIVQQGKRQIGIVVDGVSEILRVADEEIRPVAELAFMESSAEANQVTGIAKIDGRLVVLLDLTRVLSERDQARVDAVSSA